MLTSETSVVNTSQGLDTTYVQRMNYDVLTVCVWQGFHANLLLKILTAQSHAATKAKLCVLLEETKSGGVGRETAK